MILPSKLLHFEDVAIKCPKQFLLYVEFICRRACDKKIQTWTFKTLYGFQPSKIWMFFWKSTVEQVSKSFSGRNNSLKPPVFEFCDNLPYDLEESIELRTLISWVLGLLAFKNAKLSANRFFFVFELPLWIYLLLWYINFSFFCLHGRRSSSLLNIICLGLAHFQKYKAQNIVKSSFVAFLAVFFLFACLNFALKTYCTLKMFLLCAQNNFYIKMSSYVEGHVQKNSSLNFMSLVGFQASKIWMFF